MYRVPWANSVLIALIFVASVAGMVSSSPAIEDLILDGWTVSGLLGHMFLHIGVIHLVGNLLFLWVFGNAVCAKFGNVAFLPVFVLLGLASAAIHNLFDGRSAVGASGAINGIVGIFLVLYPRNDITCGWWFLVRVGTFTLSSFWMILLWLAFDLWGATTGGGAIAYWAHLGGIAAGMLIATVTLKAGWIEMDKTEQSLLDIMGWSR